MKRLLQVAGIAAVAIACNGIRAAPIYDDDELDAGADVAVVEASPCGTAPTTCTHDPSLPTPVDGGADADAAANTPSCTIAARLLQCPYMGGATVSCPSDTGTCAGAMAAISAAASCS